MPCQIAPELSIILFEVFLVMAVSADPQKINSFISVGFVDLMFSFSSEHSLL